MADVKVKACCDELQNLWDGRFLTYTHGVYEMAITAEKFTKKGEYMGREFRYIMVNNCCFCGKSLYGLYETSYNNTVLE